MTGPNSHDLNLILAELVLAWNSHDAAHVASLYATDYIGVDVSESEPQRGPEGVRHTVQRYLNAFSDLHLTQEETVVNSDRAAIKVTVRGTYQGGIMNIPATGRTTELHGVAFLTFDNGKITRASYLWDVAGFLRNIGLLPDL